MPITSRRSARGQPAASSGRHGPQFRAAVGRSQRAQTTAGAAIGRAERRTNVAVVGRRRRQFQSSSAHVSRRDDGARDEARKPAAPHHPQETAGNPRGPLEAGRHRGHRVRQRAGPQVSFFKPILCYVADVGLGTECLL